MFSEIKDQNKVKTILSNLISTDHFPHALLFYGPKGVGKFLTAKAIVKYFNCRNSDPKQKGNDHCSICSRIDEEIYPDLTIVRTEKTIKKSGEEKEAKEIRKDQIKEVMKIMKYKPFEGEYKFFIIDGAENMNNISENAFLKTLEEPLPNNHIILISHNINKMLPTVLSRCITIKFNRLKENTVLELLRKKYELSSEETERISFMANGSLNGIEFLTENKMADEIISVLDAIIECIAAKNIDMEALFMISQKIHSLQLNYLDHLFDLLLLYLHSSYLTTVHDAGNSRFFKYYLNFKTKNIKLNSYNIIISEVIKTKFYLVNTNVDVKLLVENLILLIRKNIL
ncbi:MAG: AAA family ATPase [Spirochaetes bacterium]|nr:AAA family ATPase [Spirochaetota bacterium]